MTKLRSITSLGSVLVFAACGSGGSPVTPPTGMAGAGPLMGGVSGSGGKAAAPPESTAGTSTAGSAGAAIGAGGTGGAAVGGSNEGGSNAGGSAGSAGSAGGGGTGTPDVTLPPLVTSAPGAYWKTSGALADSTSATVNVTINEAATAQKWDGFGAAFNELGWSFLSSIEMRQEAMTLLFSASDGAAFSWGRIPIGASNYAMSRYTLDDDGSDVAPVADESNRPGADLALTKFSLARDREKLIPYVKAAQAVKPNLRFWASPWTPPLWMKTSFRKTDGWTEVKKPSYYDGGSIKSDAATLSAYALYFEKFVRGYEDQGIDVEVVSAQTEPSFEESYPSCVWDKATYATFVGHYLGPAMTPLGVEVMLGTLSDWGKDVDLASAALADSSAKPFFKLVGAQWGVLEPIKLDALNANLPIWATEHKGGNYPWNPAGVPPYAHYAPNDQAYAVESWGYIRDAIGKLKVSTYNAWNMVLDPTGWGIDTSREWAQNALLVANAGSLTKTPVYYVFRHLSQYVAPGATVVGTTGGDALAFKNPDGSFVAVMFNSGVGNDHYVLAIGEKKLEFAMPGNGWATVKYKP